MLNALSYSHKCLSDLIEKYPHGNFIDATLGNGKDAEFILSQPQFHGQLFCFEIQEKAIKRSQERLNKFHTPIHYYHQSHASIGATLAHIEEFHGAIFNLGYLPGGDHQITTTFNSTYQAIKAIADKLVITGQIILVIYSGHPQGKIEKDQLLTQVSNWSQDEFQILTYQFINQKNHPPLTLIIERRASPMLK